MPIVVILLGLTVGTHVEGGTVGHVARVVSPRGACFVAAQAAGGSGFIACCVGGLLLSGLGEHHKEELLRWGTLPRA